jgi:hypothetical protein
MTTACYWKLSLLPMTSFAEVLDRPRLWTTAPSARDAFCNPCTTCRGLHDLARLDGSSMVRSGGRLNATNATIIIIIIMINPGFFKGMGTYALVGAAKCWPMLLLAPTFSGMSLWLFIDFLFFNFLLGKCEATFELKLPLALQVCCPNCPSLLSLLCLALSLSSMRSGVHPVCRMRALRSLRHLKPASL